MDRTVLSKRIKGLSEVFASDNAIAQDLAAMSYVIENMSEEKFASIVNPDIGADKEAAQPIIKGLAPTYQSSRGRDLVNKILERNRDYNLRSKSDVEEFVFEVMIPIMKGEQADESKLPVYSEGNPLSPKVAEEEVEAFRGQVAPMYQSTGSKDRRQQAIDSIRKLNLTPKQEEAVFEVFMPGATGQATPSSMPAQQPTAAESDEEEEVDGMYWNKGASDAVANALLKDVLGMDKSICCDTKQHLDAEQVPDSKKKQETPSTLKGEQIPQNKDNHDSGIVEKANSSKSKKAGEVPGVPDGTGPGKDSPKCPKNPENTEDTEDNGDDKGTETEASADDSTMKSEGVELIAPMSEVKLSSDEESELGKLFD